MATCRRPATGSPIDLGPLRHLLICCASARIPDDIDGYAAAERSLGHCRSDGERCLSAWPRAATASTEQCW
eukprot:2045570-Pyramimonas_sp.AAC.1